MILVPIVIAGVSFLDKCILLNTVHHSLILGIDFLTKNKCSIDLGKNLLHLRDNLVSVYLVL